MHKQREILMQLELTLNSITSTSPRSFFFMGEWIRFHPMCSKRAIWQLVDQKVFLKGVGEEPNLKFTYEDTTQRKTDTKRNTSPSSLYMTLTRSVLYQSCKQDLDRLWTRGIKRVWKSPMTEHGLGAIICQWYVSMLIPSLASSYPHNQILAHPLKKEDSLIIKVNIRSLQLRSLCCWHYNKHAWTNKCWMGQTASTTT